MADQARDELREQVRSRYARAAQAVLAPQDGSYAGCIAGALSRAEYLGGLRAAGFAAPSVSFTADAAPGLHAAVIRAVKPGA